jgi:chloramphenicol-sensitive protein RarD
MGGVMDATAGHSARGVASSLVASAMFGAMFLVSGLLDVSAESMFGWRMLVTGACFLIALLWAPGRAALADLVALLRHRWWTPLVLLCTAALVGVQMWLFAWSPMHGHGLDASLGYLLLPIVLVLSGRFVFHERVTRMQWWAVAVAVVAVAIKIVFSATFSWVTVLVCLGYAAYFALRKRFRLDTQAAFGGEVAILCLPAVALIAWSRGAATFGEQGIVIAVGLGIASAHPRGLRAAQLRGTRPDVRGGAPPGRADRDVGRGRLWAARRGSRDPRRGIDQPAPLRPRDSAAAEFTKHVVGVAVASGATKCFHERGAEHRTLAAR